MGFESMVPPGEERLRKANDLADAHVVVEPLVLRNKGYLLADQQALPLFVYSVTENATSARCRVDHS